MRKLTVHLSLFSSWPRKSKIIFNFLSCTWYCFLLSFNISASQFSAWGGGTHISTQHICTYIVHTWLSNAADTFHVFSSPKIPLLITHVSSQNFPVEEIQHFGGRKRALYVIYPPQALILVWQDRQHSVERGEWSLWESHPAWKSHWLGKQVDAQLWQDYGTGAL